ncbi:hypothetical protein [Nitrospira sp. KM1]|uniref:hypothetical protein n=1 Tax=Nitrospira sp. KM1 TaxID=1936990 RepID=UPI0015672909|nr:hypothetical protein [Nitrospira sp. KM1]
MSDFFNILLRVRLDAYSGNPQALTLYRRRGYREAGQVTFPRRALPFICFEFEVRPNHRPQERADGIR